MNIVISHVYSKDNKGDAALLSVLIADIRRQFKKADITILTLDNVVEAYEGVNQQPAFMYYAYAPQNKVLKMLNSAFILVATSLWAWMYRLTGRKLPLPARLRTVAEVYAEADLVIPVGGGYLRSSKSWVTFISLLLMVHPLYFAYVLRKPTVLYTQSIGPFFRGVEMRLMRWILPKMRLIILREEKSRRLLEHLGVTQNVVRSVDSGFLFTADEPANVRGQFNIPADRMLVGVTVRKWLSGAAQEQYESAVAAVLDHAISTYNADVVFIPQVTATQHNDDDRQASRDVFARMRHQEHAHVVTESPDHYAIKAMYNDLDMIVGTRFHSVIFSLTSGVPALAVEYEHKTSGIMEDLGLGNWVVRIEDATADSLIAKFDEMVANRDAYKATLHQVLPPYLEKARDAIRLTEKAYNEA